MELNNILIGASIFVILFFLIKSSRFLKHKVALFFLWLAHVFEPEWVSEIASVEDTTITLTKGIGPFHTGDAVVIRSKAKKL